MFDERQFDCGTTFLSTANPALVVGDKVGLLLMMEMIIANMNSGVADEMDIIDPLFLLILSLTSSAFLGQISQMLPWSCTGW